MGISYKQAVLLCHHLSVPNGNDLCADGDEVSAPEKLDRASISTFVNLVISTSEVRQADVHIPLSPHTSCVTLSHLTSAFSYANVSNKHAQFIGC